MLYLILSILSSIGANVFFKIVNKDKTNIFQMIILNYVTTALLSYSFFKPTITSFPPIPLWLIISLGILLPSIFLIQYYSIRKVGIIKTDVAQRISIFMPLVASVTIFNEQINNQKYLSLILGFISLLFILNKVSDNKKTKSYDLFFLITIFLGFGIIDILFKNVALYTNIPYTTTLFFIFTIALFFAVLFYLGYSLYDRKKINISKHTLLYGVVLGGLNFSNIYFYLNAHKAYAESPTVVFAGMNYGVIFLATLIGYFFFKERLTKINIIGLILAFISITLLLTS